MNVGKHLICDLEECESSLLNDLTYVRKIMIEAALSINATIVGEIFHKIEPYGVTGIIAISESHLSIRTWPEYRYASVDVFTCSGYQSPLPARDVVVNGFGSKRYWLKEFSRGPSGVKKTRDYIVSYR